jgi:hypothetical protein
MAFMKQHKGYELHCEPTKLANGKFAPSLLICRSEGTHRDETKMSLPPPHEFDAQRDAADHAWAVGVRWVDDQG